MMTDLRLTAGEIAFGVGVVSTLDRALEIVRTQLGIEDHERGRAVLAASGQSLVARELATQADREVRLAGPLLDAAELVAGAEWLLRCARVTGKRVERLLFHLAPTGILAQIVEGELVHRVSPVPGVGALVDRMVAWFALPPADPARWPPAMRPLLLDRALLDELGRLSDTAAIDRELIARGVPAELSTPFAADLAAPRWKGGASLVHCPKGQPASVHSSLVLLSGARNWLVDALRDDGAVLGEASRERFGEAVKDMLRSLDSTTRKLDRAGELDS
jgi:hypothetical protein